MLTLPVISSAEIERTYAKMIAEKSDPAEKRKLESDQKSAVGAQQGREVSGFLFLGLSGALALASFVSIFIKKQK